MERAAEPDHGQAGASAQHADGAAEEEAEAVRRLAEDGRRSDRVVQRDRDRSAAGARAVEGAHAVSERGARARAAGEGSA